ncbi:MAG TPA: hypothetical protein VGO58_07490 [Chitinophagaceae bacterium]|jgi:hypothetical protein|nr:hypothetical protein [Chitinophagaceae bacterium]
MPTNSLLNASQKLPAFSPKKYRLVILFLLSPLFFFGQTLTGLWTGALSNDSNTIRKDQSFEIALTEYRGKVYGYSRSEFIVDDTLYYVVKRVKGTIDGDLCEVTDDEIVAYNFRGKLDKGIKVTSIFRRNQNDSTWYLDGTWKTNATKKYYAVTGKVNLEEEKDLTASKIFPHLEELKLADDVAFYKDRKEGTPVVKLVKPEKIIAPYSAKPGELSINSDATVSASKPDLGRAEAKPVPEEEMVKVKKADADLPKTDTKPIGTSSVTIVPAASTKTIAETKLPEWDPVVVKKPEGELAKNDTKPVPSSVVDIRPSLSNKTVAENKIPVITKDNIPSSVTDNKPVKDQALVKTDTKQNQPIAKNNTVTRPADKPNNTPSSVSNKPAIETKKPDMVSNDIVKQNPVTPVSVIPKEEKPLIEIISKAATVAGRKSEFSQVVSFKSDSLELSLYDNGEIDGDTVSIYMDGEVIMSRQGLKASAIKKTIYLTPGKEDFTLVLFAENLGKYPPNTGLLVVHDGEDVYNLRFSSDFQKNAGIAFRRKH